MYEDDIAACSLVLFEWCGCTQKNAPKKVHVTLNSLTTFQETQISFLKCIEHQIFLDPQLQPFEDFRYH